MKPILCLVYCFVPFVFFFLLSCATQTPPPPGTLPDSSSGLPAVPPEYPSAQLAFDRLEAVTPDSLSLLFRLEADNPRDQAAVIQAAAWKTAVNGVEREGEGALTLEGEPPAAVAAASSGTFSLWLEAPIAAGMFPDQGREGEAVLTADIVFTYPSGGEVKIPVSAAAVFPLVREPAVQITAIAVQKAELINTRFKVSLKIDNPNVFPVELSAFRYELYNAGRFWADGVQEDILTVPAKSSVETDVSLVMNFINMNRELLNQVAAMQDIHYRFTGEALVSTGIEGFPQFAISYDLSGYSTVVE
jgi:LEA14-like dessication related protein